MSWRCSVLLFVLFGLSFVVQAQTQTWQAWLYDSGIGDLILIDGQGFIRDQTKLPLTRNMSSFPYNVAVSASGSKFAYVLSDTHRTELIVYDSRPGIREIVLQLELPTFSAETLGLSSNAGQLFAPDETHLAFGYSRQEGGWEILLLDTQTDRANLILRGGAGSAADLPVDNSLTPVVRAFDGVRVAFTLVQPSSISHIGTSWQSYIWNTQTNTVQLASSYLSLDSDVFAPTGEIVDVLTDSRSSLFLSPSLMASGGLGIGSSDERLFSPRFVSNGQGVLYGELDAQGKIVYRLVRRGISESEIWEAASTQIIGSVRGTATGFAYTVDTIKADDTNGTTLFDLEASHDIGEGRPLFVSDTNVRLRLVWLNDPRMTPSLPWANPDDALPQPTEEVGYNQRDTWQTWIYQDNGIAIRLDSEGKTLDLEAIPPENALEGIPDDQILRLTRLIASPDGTLLTYVLGVNDSIYVQVYDTQANRVLMTHRIDGVDGTRPPHALDRAPHNLLNETQTALAFGYGKSVGWQIDVLDVGSGALITSLSPESPSMRRLITDTAFGALPVIQAYAEGQVYFTIQGAGSLTPPYPSFVWDTVLDIVNPTLLYANPMSETFAPTGEVIMAMIDDRLSNTADRFLYGQLNALHVYDPTTGTRAPFYNAPELWLQKPIFIQNGERILSGGVDAAGAFKGWTVLERDGEVAGVLPLTNDLIDVAGTGNGFLYIPRDETGATLTLFYVNTRQALDGGQLVWSIPRTGRPQIVWMSFPTQDVAYRPWRAMAVPIDAGQAVASDETSPAALELSIGGNAIVRTTGGDALLMRAAAGTDADVLTRLNSGTRVTIVDGPLVVFGQTWWQILTPGGASGWVVGEAEGVYTLTPEGN